MVPLTDNERERTDEYATETTHVWEHVEKRVNLAL